VTGERRDKRDIAQLEDDDDPYVTGVCRWWHLSEPSPELRRALEDGWISPPGRGLDLGCGLGTEAGFLTDAGFDTTGIDLSPAALTRAATLHPSPHFARADALRLPFADASFDLLFDRGCFHYIAAADRAQYAAEARRVLRPGGRLLLRACLRTAGERNDLDEPLIRRTFAAWCFLMLEQRVIASDTREMDALLALLERPSAD
jgi:SAM-dependent methyltransferase